MLITWGAPPCRCSDPFIWDPFGARTILFRTSSVAILDFDGFRKHGEYMGIGPENRMVDRKSDTSHVWISPIAIQTSDVAVWFCERIEVGSPAYFCQETQLLTSSRECLCRWFFLAGWSPLALVCLQNKPILVSSFGFVQQWVITSVITKWVCLEIGYSQIWWLNRYIYIYIYICIYIYWCLIFRIKMTI